MTTSKSRDRHLHLLLAAALALARGNPSLLRAPLANRPGPTSPTRTLSHLIRAKELRLRPEISPVPLNPTRKMSILDVLEDFEPQPSIQTPRKPARTYLLRPHQTHRLRQPRLTSLIRSTVTSRQPKSCLHVPATNRLHPATPALLAFSPRIARENFPNVVKGPPIRALANLRTHPPPVLEFSPSPTQSRGTFRLEEDDPMSTRFTTSSTTILIRSIDCHVTFLITCFVVYVLLLIKTSCCVVSRYDLLRFNFTKYLYISTQFSRFLS